MTASDKSSYHAEVEIYLHDFQYIISSLLTETFSKMRIKTAWPLNLVFLRKETSVCVHCNI